MIRHLVPVAHFLAAFGFICLPAGALLLFSFQDGSLPVPPFEGPSMRWYRDVLADDDLTGALVSSLVVALGSAALSVTLGFGAA